MKNKIVTIVLLIAAATLGFCHKGEGRAEAALPLERKAQQNHAASDESAALTPTIIHPWWVVASGGGSAAGGGLLLISSIGQPAAQPMTGSGLSLEGGYIPGMRELAGTTASISQSFDTLWNLISVPLMVGDYRAAILYPTATSRAYKFENGYVAKDTLENGTGYWLKFDSAQSVQVRGTTITYDTIAVDSLWNIIGCVSYPILASGVIPVPPLTVLSNFFGFASGYQPEDTLLPGRGYWVKVSQAGRLVIQSESMLASSTLALQGGSNKSKVALKDLVRNDEVNTIVIRDAKGRTQKLYFLSKRKDVDLASCEVPPPPPSGVMDVRYMSQRAAEVYDEGRGERQSFPIQIVDAEYPLTVSWSLVEVEGKYALEIVKPSGERHQTDMVRGGTLNLEEPSLAFKLQIESRLTAQLPTEFALRQNYPNPFNPTTTIKYDLPKDSRVSLKLFNILGQEVATLVNEEQKAGYKSVEWNANNFASGVYFYHIQAGDFVATKKLLLLK